MNPSLHPPSKLPDPPNVLDVLPEVLPNSGGSSDQEGLLEDEIAVALQLIQKKRQRLEALQKHKRGDSDSIQTSGVAESETGNSDVSSHRPAKALKLNNRSTAPLSSNSEPAANIDNSPRRATVSLAQMGTLSSLDASSMHPPPSGNPSKHCVCVSLEDPASSTDHTRGQCSLFAWCLLPAASICPVNVRKASDSS